jgi:ubiquitin carboxyl-terminal hydrolase 2/21
MNSCLQCVSNVPPLADIFLSPSLYTNSSAATSRTRGHVARAWVDLMRRFWGGGGEHGAPSAGRVETPDKLKSVVGAVASRFLGYEQQDSQEFLGFLLDALIDDTNRVSEKTPYRELSERPDQSDADVSQDWWRYYGERCVSRVRDLLTGQLRTTVRCDVCSHVSRAFDPFTNLALPIPKAAQCAEKFGGGDGCSLRDCLASFVTPETLSGSEAHYCSRCKAHRSCTKTMAIFRLPPVLILHLKRFTFSTFRRSKISTDVRFPTEGLDMRPYLADRGAWLP